jgi:hypothetical protein
MSEVLRNANTIGVNFLLADLDMALAFMDVADTALKPSTVTRNRENARRAYDNVLRLLQKLCPDHRQKKALDGKLDLLKTRLEAAGYKL